MIVNTQQSFDQDELLKMDQKESDKLLACTEIISIKLRKDAKIIEDVFVTLQGKLNDEAFRSKVTGDLLNKCYYSLDEATTATIFLNGTFMEPEFSEDLLDFASIDYSTYKLLSPSEFNITPETQILFMKIEKARDNFIVNSKARQETNKSDFKLFGYSIRDIPKGLNVLITVVILTVFMGSLLYLLKKVMKNEKKAGKKKQQ
jgi:hypothetical protein